MMDITSIRYINMDKNWHRRLFIESLLLYMPYKVIRCPGVEFSRKNDRYAKYLTHGINDYIEMEGKLNADMRGRLEGVVGCWIAHTQALEAVMEETGITVILEDDFICHSQFFRSAIKMINTFDRDFDMIVFDPWGSGPLQDQKIGENMYRPRKPSYPHYGGAHCIFVNNANISKLLHTHLNSEVVDYDGFVMMNDKINCYVFYTGQCMARGIGSDITKFYKINYDLLSIPLCFLPPTIRDKTKKFRKFFYKPGEKRVRY